MANAEASEILPALRIAIIGTGPLSMLKAHFLSKKNPAAQITLIDFHAQTGGAWYSDQSPGGHLIECGCHIWSYAPHAYRFIEKELGVKLTYMHPAPVFIGKKIAVPYSLKNSIDTYKAFFKFLVKFQFSKLRKHNQLPYIHYRIFGKKNKYPPEGSMPLVQKLEQLIAANPNIQIRLNTRITDLEINDQVSLSNETEKWVFDKVILTYVSHIQKLVLPGKTLTGTPRHVDYIHFLVSSDKPLKKKMSYWRFVSDPVVHRITDISYQTHFNEHLFLVGIKGDAFHAQSSDALFAHVNQLMIKSGLLEKDQKTELVKTHIFPTYYMDRTLLENLKPFSDKVSSLQTTDLMYGLHYLLLEEMPHLINTPK